MPDGMLTAPLVLELVLAAPQAVEIAWNDAAQGESAYIVQRAQDMGGMPGGFSDLEVTAPDTQSFQDTSVLPGESWWYRVSATWEGSAPSQSNAVAVSTPSSDSEPKAPEGLAVVAQGSTWLGLEWVDAADGEEGYYLERAKDQSGSPDGFQVIATLAGDLEHYEDTTLQSGKSYWYRLRAFDGTQASDYAGPVEGTTIGSTTVTSRTDVIVAVGQQNRVKQRIEADGRYYVSFLSGSGGVQVMAFASDESLVWQRDLHAGLGSNYEIFLSTDGNPWLVGSSLGGSTLVAKLRSSDGSVLFANDYSVLVKVAVDPDEDGALPVLPITGFGAGVIQADGTLAWNHTSTSWPWGFAQRVPIPGGGEVHFGNLMARFDSVGTEMWERVVLHSGFNPALIWNVHACADGTQLVLCALDDALWSGKVDAAGQLVQQAAVELVDIDVSKLLSVEDGQGGLLVVHAAQKPVAFHYDAVGELEWSLEIDAPGIESVGHVLPRLGGGCFLVGQSASVGGGVWVLALGPAGDLEWERIVAGDSELELSTALAAYCTPGDEVVLAGLVLGSGTTTRSWLARLDSAGNLSSARVWGTDGFAMVQDVHALADGRRVLSGFALGSQAPFLLDLWTAILDPHGEVQGSVVFTDTAPSFGEDEPLALVSRPDGSLSMVYLGSDGAFSNDVLRTLWSDTTSMAPGAQGHCGKTLKSVTAGIVATPGVALTSNLQADVTAQHPVTVADWNIIQAGGLQPSALATSNFQGTLPIAEACGP